MSVTSPAAEALRQPGCLASSCSSLLVRTRTVLVAIFVCVWVDVGMLCYNGYRCQSFSFRSSSAMDLLNLLEFLNLSTDQITEQNLKNLK